MQDAPGTTRRLRGLAADRQRLAPPDFELDAALTRVEAKLLDGADPTIVGRYRVVGRVGLGGMGLVLKAIDERLDRAVAIKRLDPKLVAGRTRERLLAEARAMAKVRHPNVVAVFDVLDAEDGPLIVMEYVEGSNLRAWLQRPRSPSEVLEVMRQVALGLQAVHAACLVHLDLKPSNVVVDRSARAQITDFGIAVERRSSTPSDEPTPPSIPGDLSTASMFGTPLYMAPEQHDGDAVDHRSDQFAFCEIVWEALVGAHPYAAHAIDERTIARAKRKGPPPWPSNTRAPARLIAAIVRGLDPRPDQRWPDLEVLQRELRRAGTDDRRRSRMWMGASGLLLAAGLVGFVGIDRSRCEDAPSEIDEVWNETVRQRIATHLGSVDPAIAERTVGVLERRASAWSEASIAACEVAIEDPAPARCLRRASLELASATKLLGRLDRPGVARAVDVASGVPSATHCLAPAPDDILFAAVPDAESAAAVGAVAAHFRAGKYATAHRLAVDLLAAAPEPSIRIEAEYWRARIAMVRERWEEAEDAATRAMNEAVATGGVAMAIRSAAALIEILATRASFAEASRVLAIARSMLESRDLEPELLAAVERSAGQLHFQRSDISSARRSVEAALQALPRGPDREFERADLLVSLGNFDAIEGDFQHAAATLSEAKALMISVVGPEHPGLVDLALAEATVHRDLDHFADARRVLEEALAMLARQGLEREREAIWIRIRLAELAALEGEETAAEDLVRWLQSLDLQGADERWLGKAHGMLAVQRMKSGQLQPALQDLEHALDLMTRHGEPPPSQLESIHAHLADVSFGLGQPARALHHYDQALAIAERLFPATDIRRAGFELGRARCLDELGRQPEAIAILRSLYAEQPRFTGPPRTRAAIEYGLARTMLRVLGPSALLDARRLGRTALERAAIDPGLQRRIEGWIVTLPPGD